ncbi:MAG: nitroreductase family protein [Patescibacteria group bacterium]
MTNITKALQWRYATKQFDATKKISDETLQTLKESIQLSPSSFGLQPYTVIDVVTPEHRAALRAAGWDQAQFTDASHLFVFAVPTSITDADTDAFIKLTADTRNTTPEALAGYAGMIKGSVNSRTTEQNISWAAKQAYIALGFLLETAALLEVDAAPMEGFDSVKTDEILGLTTKGLTSVVVSALGYRSADDKYADLPKVRTPMDKLFIQA